MENYSRNVIKIKSVPYNFVKWLLIIYLPLTFLFHVCICNRCHSDEHSNSGKCYNSSCIRPDEKNCNPCVNRIRLTETEGYITDGPGNYDFNLQCSWLIDSGDLNNTIWIEIHHFATECGWDFLYIYDGDSIYSPLIAALSGIILDENPKNSIIEIEAKSGYAYFYFFSDSIYNMTGFDLYYRINACPAGQKGKICSGNGDCLGTQCKCNFGFTGKACDVLLCPNNCYSGNCTSGKCVCPNGFTGSSSFVTPYHLLIKIGYDCSQIIMDGYWGILEPESSYFPPPRASHNLVGYDHYLLITGGKAFVKETYLQIYQFDLLSKIWNVYMLNNDSVTPSQRFSHSTIIDKNKLIVFGGSLLNGTIVNEIWIFDIYQRIWNPINAIQESCDNLCGPLSVMGHSAVLFNRKMLIFFGYSPIYGYCNLVQEFDLDSLEWSIVRTKGALIWGKFGHTSVYDKNSNRVYIYGGYQSEGKNRNHVSGELYAYDPQLYVCVSDVGIYLHTSVIHQNLMIVFGGNQHGTSSSINGKCYSQQFLIYDIVCNTWEEISLPDIYNFERGRFGHSAVIHQNIMFLYGGFNGFMQKDILYYKPGNCSHYNNIGKCLNAKFGVKCVWNRKLHKCELYNAKFHQDTVWIKCNQSISKQDMIRNQHVKLCQILQSCQSCLYNSFECAWCLDNCVYKKCKTKVPEITYSNHCPSHSFSNCAVYQNCQACHLEPSCKWEKMDHCITNQNNLLNDTEKISNFSELKPFCLPSCNSLTTCHDCNFVGCLWCEHSQRCVENYTYLASFLYGQCLKYSTSYNLCRTIPSDGTLCSSYQTCQDCLSDTACGWCSDDLETGIGTCIDSGHYNHMDVKTRNEIFCPYHSWFYTECPSCQCNGHSICNDSQICLQPCNDQTEGLFCQYCKTGYYGNPLNGGTCEACECNGHGELCDRNTGRCFCTIKGIVGDQCNRCDAQSHYFGDPLNGGTCYYELSVDYQFTFNLSKEEDKHYKKIHFRNTPSKPDIDTEFFISCSVIASLNISFRKGINSSEKFLFTNVSCENFRVRFSKNDYQFGTEENTTFFVYVYDVHPPLLIMVAFSQHPKLDLWQFFITFSTCFLTLLIIAAISWKIKQKCDLYRHRQQLFLEMEKMASRPFAHVTFEIDGTKNYLLENEKTKQPKNFPSPIAMQLCFGNKAAIVSLLVELPKGDGLYTPADQSGLAIASALISVVNSKKINKSEVNQKEDIKLKYAKAQIVDDERNFHS